MGPMTGNALAPAHLILFTSSGSMCETAAFTSRVAMSLAYSPGSPLAESFFIVAAASFTVSPLCVTTICWYFVNNPVYS